MWSSLHTSTSVHYTSTHPQGLEKQLQVAYERLEDHKDQFTQMGSGWDVGSES